MLGEWQIRTVGPRVDGQAADTQRVRRLVALDSIHRVDNHIFVFLMVFDQSTFETGPHLVTAFS